VALQDRDRSAFEKSINHSILQIQTNLSTSVRDNASEYAPIIFWSTGTEVLAYVDLTNYPIINDSTSLARDIGDSAMSQPTYQNATQGQLGMGLANLNAQVAWCIVVRKRVVVISSTFLNLSIAEWRGRRVLNSV
jgi:hypothetical protein